MRMQWTLTDFAEMDAKYDFKVSLAFVVLALNYIYIMPSHPHTALYSPSLHGVASGSSIAASSLCSISVQT